TLRPAPGPVHLATAVSRVAADVAALAGAALLALEQLQGRWPAAAAVAEADAGAAAGLELGRSRRLRAAPGRAPRLLHRHARPLRPGPAALAVVRGAAQAAASLPRAADGGAAGRAHREGPAGRGAHLRGSRSLRPGAEAVAGRGDGGPCSRPHQSGLLAT